ncbi:MAG: hypothetical protein V3U03_10545 [Myxococcota bacterium]
MLARCTLLTALLLTLGGCLLPRQGTPVLVDMRAGDFWSGDAVLVEVSEDRERCKVAVRDRAFVVRKLWVDCSHVHPEHSG